MISAPASSIRLGAGGKGLDHPVDPRSGPGPPGVGTRGEGSAGRWRFAPAALVGADGTAAAPGRGRRGLAAGVRQLDRRHRALFPDEPKDPRQRFDLAVLPDTQVVRD